MMYSKYKTNHIKQWKKYHFRLQILKKNGKKLLMGITVNGTFQMSLEQ